MTSEVLRAERSPALLTGLLVVVWGALMGAYRDADPYMALGCYALFIVVVIALRHKQVLRGWLRPTWSAVNTGALMGVLMVGLTYPAFELATHLLPALKPQVAELYRVTQRPNPLTIMPALVLIILAEELLWRGALMRLFRTRPLLGACLSVVTYTFAQACTGSVIVALLALTCGTIWTVQRSITGSLLSPLIAHLIWTPTVLVFLPVT